MRPATPSPERLAAAQQGDPRALAELLDRFAPVVLGWCKRLGGPRIDANDAAQDVLVVMLDHVGRVHSPAVFRAYLFGVTRRVVAKHRRTAWLRKWVGDWVGDRADEAGLSPHRAAELSDTARRVQAALEVLPAHMREVLVLCVVEERTDEEAAELLGVPAGTVKSRLRRAREKFAAAARHRGLTGFDLEHDRRTA